MSSVTTTEPATAVPTPETATRMPAGERRESILEAATAVFGERGYIGATTDAVAKAAGVSQPYVVRMFGTKEQLFLEVLQRALDRLLAVFRGVIAEHGAGGKETLAPLIGNAYADLLKDRGLLLSLMQAFMLGSDPVIGPAARGGFLQVYTVLRDEAGFTSEEADGFLAHGMLLNTLVAIGMAGEYADDPRARDLIDTCAPSKVPMILDLGLA
jgi:TetR/AcrR family transcriptional regulator